MKNERCSQVSLELNPLVEIQVHVRRGIQVRAAGENLTVSERYKISAAGENFVVPKRC